MNKGVQDVLSGRTDKLTVQGREMDFRRPISPSAQFEPRQTLTERYMSHLPTRDALLNPPSRTGRNQRTIDL
jgi:hypothetical protein